MNKFTLLTLFLLCAFMVQGLNVTNYKLPALRAEYLAASKDEDAARDFYAKMEKYTGKEAVVLGYKAASEAVMAKYVWNPYSKLKHLNTATNLFSEAVALNEQNPEIRFLRFVVETHVPAYLKKSNNLEEDKAIVIESLKDHKTAGLQPSLARIMRDFLVAKDRCTPEEREMLQNLRI